MKAVLTLEERHEPWTLVIEPWAQALDVPKHARVTLELYDIGEEDEFRLEVAEDGTFLAIEEGRFDVRIGAQVHRFDFGLRTRVKS